MTGQNTGGLWADRIKQHDLIIDEVIRKIFWCCDTVIPNCKDYSLSIDRQRRLIEVCVKRSSFVAVYADSIHEIMLKADMVPSLWNVNIVCGDERNSTSEDSAGEVLYKKLPQTTEDEFNPHFTAFVLTNILSGDPETAAEFKRVIAEGAVAAMIDWIHNYISKNMQNWRNR
jgi:hypothetical protein